jgi:hypothetical protein
MMTVRKARIRMVVRSAIGREVMATANCNRKSEL